MSEWRDYIKLIVEENFVEDVALVSCYDNMSVWASKPGGVLAAITGQEVSMPVGAERSSFLTSGITIGGRRAVVIRDSMVGQRNGPTTMDIRTMGHCSLAIAVARTTRALVFLMGKRGFHGGLLNKSVCDQLREMGV